MDGSKLQAREDFNRAKSKARFGSIFHLLQPEKTKLLSFYSIKELVKPKSETYCGMQVVQIKDIVGSEGRYHDFNKVFLPKREHLRYRWERVDEAVIKDIILPPIKLYKLGDAYFVRDGNHRVSVARTQKIEAIDAEVTALNTEIPFTAEMSEADMKKQIIKYERKRVMDKTRLPQYIDTDAILFTAPGRYEEMLRHILAHKEHKEQTLGNEIEFGEAASSWYNELYMPTITILEKQKIMGRFPGRTVSDLYMWIIKQWDELRQSGHHDPSLGHAINAFFEKHNNGWFGRLLRRVSGTRKIKE